MLTGIRPDLWDADKWRTEMSRRQSTPLPSLPAAGTAASPAPAPTDELQPSSPASTPMIPPPKRKPIPAYLDETVTVSPFPTLSTVPHSIPTAPQIAQSLDSGLLAPPPLSPRSDNKRKDLVRLLDSLPEGPLTDETDPLYVTKTTKARFDGAMQEIAQALREE